MTAVNDAPTINATAAQTSEDIAVAHSIVAFDVDGDVLEWAVTTAPTRGTLQGTPPSLTYVPQANWSGTDSVTVRVTDPSGLTASATLAITVTAVNDAPTLAAIALATTSNTQVLRTLVGADVDGDVLTYRLTSVATRGTASISGNILTYVPNANAIGSDSFTVEVVDTSGSAGAASVNVTITGAGMPVPWALSAIGTVTPVSTTSFNWVTNVFTLSGAGLGLTAKADSAAILSQPITGDVTIILENAVELVNPPERLLLSNLSSLSWPPIWHSENADVVQLQGALVRWNGSRHFERLATPQMGRSCDFHGYLFGFRLARACESSSRFLAAPSPSAWLTKT